MEGATRCCKQTHPRIMRRLTRHASTHFTQEEQSFKRRMGYVTAADATPRSVHGGSRLV